MVVAGVRFGPGQLDVGRILRLADQQLGDGLLGLVVVAGMSVGTLFTLFVLPAVYTVLAEEATRNAYTTVGSN